MNLFKMSLLLVIFVTNIGDQFVDAQTSRYRNLRTWTDSTGQYKLKARLVACKENQIELETENGEIKQLPLIGTIEVIQACCLKQ